MASIVTAAALAKHSGAGDNPAKGSSMDATTSRYPEIYARWQRDPKGFWGEAAQRHRLDREAEDGVRSQRRRLRPLVSRRRLQHLLQRGRPPRHAGRGTQAAIIYDSPVTGTKQTITYAALQTKTETLAGILQATSASARATASSSTCRWCRRRWSRMLACARIGAVHSVVFGGFAPKELATRIDDAKPKVILSASCGIEAARVVAYKPLLDAAIDLAKHKPDACMILQRPQLACDADAGRDHDWQATWRRGAGVGEERARAACR